MPQTRFEATEQVPSSAVFQWVLATDGVGPPSATERAVCASACGVGRRRSRVGRRRNQVTNRIVASLNAESSRPSSPA